MRIVHLLSSLNVGGAEVAVLRLAARQRDFGASVEVASLSDGPLRARAADLGIVPTVLGDGRGHAAFQGMVSLLARQRPHVVNSHNPAAHRFARMARVVGARVVMTLHGEPSRSYGSIVAPLWTTRIIAVSEQVRARFLERHPGYDSNRIVTIHNGVPIPDSSEDPASRPPLGEFTLVLVARLDPLKAIEVLIDAVALANAATPLRLLIVGDGPEREALGSQVAALGLQGTVEFLGMVDDVTPTLRRADAIVLSSRTEGLSLSLLEGMARGHPVIATAVGGTVELVSDGETGLLVPPNDPRRFADAIRSLASDLPRTREMGRRARARVRDHFSLDLMARSYLANYATLPRW